MEYDLDSLTLMLNTIALIASGFAIYYFTQIYSQLKKGPLAWLLLVVTSIFLIATSLIPTLLFIFNSFDLYLVFLLFALWVAVYTSFFAGAGFVLFQAFARIPKASLGKYLTGSLQFQQVEAPMREKASNDSASRNILVKYKKDYRFEDGVIQIASSNIKVANILLISVQPQIKAYRKELAEFLDIGTMKIVELTENKLSHEKNMIQIPFKDTESIKEIITKAPKGTLVIMDSLSEYIKKLGFDAAFKNLSIINEIISMEKGFIGFVDLDMHQDSEIDILEDLFITKYYINNENMEMEKGTDRYAGPINNFIEYKEFALR